MNQQHTSTRRRTLADRPLRVWGHQRKGRACAAVLIAGSLALSACQSPAAAPPANAAMPALVSVPVVDVKRETVRAHYSAGGTVEARDQVAVVPKVGGRVLNLPVEVGQHVNAGDLLAELDHAALDSQVAQAEAAVAVAQARLAQAERGARAEDVAMAGAQRDAAGQQARAAAAQATAAAQGLTTLDSQVAAGLQQAAGAAAQAEAAAAQAQAARVRIEQVKNPRAEDVAALSGQVNVAKIRLAQAQGRDEEVRVAATQVELARVSLQQALDGNRPEAIRTAQSALDQAEVALNNITQMPVRAEDIEAARLAAEGADAGWRGAQDVAQDAAKAYDAARRISDNLPFGMTRAQADIQLAQAEANLHTAQAGVEQRRVQRDQARAAYEKARSGATDWDVRLAQLRVDQARAQLDLTRNPDPARTKAAQLQVEQAQLQLDARTKQIGFDLQLAEEGVRQAEAQLSKLVNPGPLDLQALEEQAAAAQAQAQAALASAGAARSQADALLSQRAAAESTTVGAGSQAAAAQAAVRQAEAALALRSNPITAEDLGAARAAVQQARAALDGARTQRAEATIYAPISGVVASRGASVGTLAGPQAPLVTLVSEAIEVAVPVEETQVGRVAPGQPVAVMSPAFPGHTFPGTVLWVTPSGDQRTRAFTARVRVDDTTGRLKPGMYVQASVATDDRPDVTAVPREALVQKEGKTAAYVVGPSNQITQRAVEVGAVGELLAEVTSGLQPGDRVAVGALDQLRSGLTVAPVSAPASPVRSSAR